MATPENGAQIRWRVEALERVVELKADRDDVVRIETALDRLSSQVNKLVYAVLAATLSGATAAVLLAVNLAGPPH